jgi:hypothetical protein
MSDQCARVVSLSVEIIREEHVHLVDQQNLRALIFAQVDNWFISLELFLEDVGCENATQFSFSIDL